MAYYEFVWTDEIVDHLAEHDVTPMTLQESSASRIESALVAVLALRAVGAKLPMADTCFAFMILKRMGLPSSREVPTRHGALVSKPFQFR